MRISERRSDGGGDGVGCGVWIARKELTRKSPRWVREAGNPACRSESLGGTADEETEMRTRERKDRDRSRHWHHPIGRRTREILFGSCGYRAFVGNLVSGRPCGSQICVERRPRLACRLLVVAAANPSTGNTGPTRGRSTNVLTEPQREGGRQLRPLGESGPRCARVCGIW